MSETPKRIISGVTIGLIVVLVLYFYRSFASLPAFLMVLLFSLLGVEEFYRLTDRGLDGRPVRRIGYFFSVLILLSFYLDFLVVHPDRSAFPPAVGSLLDTFSRIHSPLIPVIMLFLVVASTYSMIFRPLDGTAFTISTTVAGPLYAAMPFGIVFSLMALPGGMFLFVYIILATVMTDVGAYFAGRWFGRHNAGLKVSPKKTYEGYVGGVVFANLFTQGFVYLWIFWNPGPPPSFIPGWVESVLITLCLSFISIFGDLVESALKRDARLKDSSSTIPGHGGVLDLVDAMLFTIPIGYYYFYLKSSAFT